MFELETVDRMRTESVNRQLEAKTRTLADWKGYTSDLTKVSPGFVIDAYHRLWRIEKAFRMSKRDLQGRPIYHGTRESIDARLTIVFAALAVSHWIEHQTNWLNVRQQRLQYGAGVWNFFVRHHGRRFASTALMACSRQLDVVESGGATREGATSS